MNNNVDHPSHYTGRDIGYECIDLAQYQTFLVGNAIKYLWRYKDKGHPVEDLRKARWYATRASEIQETVDVGTGNCKDILIQLTASTSGYESMAWVGLLSGEWRVVLSALDMMTKGGRER